MISRAAAATAPAPPVGLEARISALEEEIKSLKKENAGLKSTVATLKRHASFSCSRH